MKELPSDDDNIINFYCGGIFIQYYRLYLIHFYVGIVLFLYSTWSDYDISILLLTITMMRSLKLIFEIGRSFLGHAHKICSCTRALANYARSKKNCHVATAICGTWFNY